MGLRRKITRERAGVRGARFNRRTNRCCAVVLLPAVVVYSSLVLPPKPSQSGGDGATGAGAGFDAGFFFFFASVAFVIPFFLRAEVPRFAFLDFFATFNLPIGSTKLCQHDTAPFIS